MTPRTAIPLGPMDDEESGAILVTDTIRRLGRLENQQNQMLPILGKVAEAVDNLTQAVGDIKTDVKTLGTEFTAFRIETSGYGSRLECLELFQNRHDTMSLNELEKARIKAEAILEQNRIKAEAVLEENRKERVAKRNDLLKLVGTAIVGVVTAAIVTALGLK
jgi:regulator of replication initiation timing